MSPKNRKGTKSAVVSIVLDKSGSMSHLASDTIGSYNRFVREQAEGVPNARFFLTLFDTEIRQPYRDMTLAEAPNLDSRMYSPSGGTALYDAIGRAVHDIDDLADKPSKVVFVILTDGQENSSREFDKARILRLISDRTEKLDWQFVYLGANQNSFSESAKIGIRSGSTSNWDYSGIGVNMVMTAASTATSDYLSGATRSVNMAGTNGTSADPTFVAPNTSILGNSTTISDGLETTNVVSSKS